MALTPEQRQANDELNAAIAKLMDAMGFNNGTMVVTDWLVCVAQHGYDQDGDSQTGISYLIRDGDLAWHRLLGLVEAVRLRLASVYADDD
jgi:hypothetical protein